jgi:hypothetical protein
MAPPARQVDGKLEPVGTLGFYGCSGRVVRVGVPKGVTRGPRLIAVDPCPACGVAHSRIRPSWRKPTAFDEGREPEVVVDDEGQPIA